MQKGARAAGLIVGFCILACVAPIRSQAQTPPVLVLQGGLLIDGTGRTPIDNSVIVIEGDRFKAVGRSGEVARVASRP